MTKSPSNYDKKVEEILAMEMQTLYSQTHHTGVRVQLTKQSRKEAKSQLRNLLADTMEEMIGDNEQIDTTKPKESSSNKKLKGRNTFRASLRQKVEEFRNG